MPSNLALIERTLQPLAPRFDALLKGSIIDAKALIQQVLVSVERSPKVAQCTPQSIINGTNTAAVLRLPIDGATGQFFLLPFSLKGTMVAQPAVGYKGYNTIAARGGISITAGVVREGDLEWDFREGSGGFIRHRRKLDNDGRIIAAWALASANDRPDVPVILGIGEIRAIMEKSPSARGDEGGFSPWKDPKIGFPAMAEKTAKRRLGRSIPWQIDDGRYLTAARIEEAHEEQGAYSFVGARGEVVLEGAGSLAASEPAPPPTAAALTAPNPTGDPMVEAAKAEGLEAADGGAHALSQWWNRTPSPIARQIAGFYRDTLLPKAKAADSHSSAP
jgi:recombination protein RecT